MTAAQRDARTRAGRIVRDEMVPSHASPAFLGTFWAGATAAVLGEPRRSPYRDVRNRIGITWSRAFNRYWLDGYDAATACVRARAAGGAE